MKIAVSKGHNVYNSGRFDPGAVCNPYVEADLVDQTVDILIPLLRKQGHQVFDVTPKNKHFKNSKEAHRRRATRVNAINPDIYLDCHLNSGGGTGPETWVAKPRGLAYDYARKIVTNVHQSTGLRNRGVKVKPTMWSLSMTNCPAIIIEGGFIDSKKDMQILTPKVYAENIAKAFGAIEEGRQLTEKEVLEIIRKEKKRIEDSAIQNWQKEAIKYVKDKGFMQGYEDGSFKPNKYVTRAELAQVLYNLKGK